MHGIFFKERNEETRKYHFHVNDDTFDILLILCYFSLNILYKFYACLIWRADIFVQKVCFYTVILYKYTKMMFEERYLCFRLSNRK